MNKFMRILGGFMITFGAFMAAYCIVRMVMIAQSMCS